MKYPTPHIYELLIDKLEGTISQENNDLIEQLLKEDPELAKLWNDLNTKADAARAEAFEKSIDEKQVWQQVADRLTVQKPVPVVRMLRGKWMAAASILLVLAVAAWFIFGHKKERTVLAATDTQAIKAVVLELANGKTIRLEKDSILRSTDYQSAPAGWNTLLVPATFDHKIVLSDGTQVWLNAASTLRFPFAFPDKTREVYLTGEAFFKVAKNSQQPFIVHANQNSIEVTGTAFNVNSYLPNETITSLVEGSVTAKGSSSGTASLHPGDQSVFRNGAFVATETFDENYTLAWMNGVHYFFNAPLSDIAQVIPRWFEVKVVFDRPELATQHITGAIEKNKPLQDFIANIKTTSRINAVLEKGELHFR